MRSLEFGRTPEGRPMLALAVSRSGALTAAEARKRKLPVLLVQGGIHAGEIDGKDAGFLALREAARGPRPAQARSTKQVLLFVPVFNVDGHERFGAWNRPNQRGPREMGWRTTAQNYNLNRDYVKADAPEMQAMLAAGRGWDPLACIDLHVTDGAKFEHHISIQVEPVHRRRRRTAQDRPHACASTTIADLSAKRWLPLPFYPSFVTTTTRTAASTTACRRRASRPAISRCATASHAGRDAFVEGLPDPRARHARHHRSVLTQVAAHGSEWLKAARKPMRARRNSAGSLCRSITRRASKRAPSSSAATNTRARCRMSPAR